MFGEWARGRCVAEVTEWWLLLPRKVHILPLFFMLLVYSRSNPAEIITTVHMIIGQLVSVRQHLAQRKGKIVNETFFIPVMSKRKGGSSS